MEKQLFKHYLPAFGNGFQAMTYSHNQLSAKFQIWCRQFDLTDTESLAIWILQTGRENSYFNSYENCKSIAENAYKKLPVQDKIVDLSNV